MAETKLQSIKKGRIKAPLRYLFYGDEGVGKSTLAAGAPCPIWLDIEDGSGRLDVARYPFRDEPDGHVPRTYQDILGALNDLNGHPHEFKSVVIDTVDRLEALMWKHIVERDSNKSTNLNPKGKQLRSIEDYGYGKGYILAVDEWRALCAELDRLRAKGMNVILLSHATIRVFRNPEGEDYDRYHLRINDKAAGFLQEWADVVGFCCFEEGASSLETNVKAKGYSTGRRLLRLERTAAFDAKSRISLPATVELDAGDPWAPLGRAVSTGQDLDAKVLTEMIQAELIRLNDETVTAKARAMVNDAKGDVEALNRILNALRKKTNKENQNG